MTYEHNDTFDYYNLGSKSLDTDLKKANQTPIKK